MDEFAVHLGRYERDGTFKVLRKTVKSGDLDDVVAFARSLLLEGATHFELFDMTGQRAAIGAL